MRKPINGCTEILIEDVVTTDPVVKAKMKNFWIPILRKLLK